MLTLCDIIIDVRLLQNSAHAWRLLRLLPTESLPVAADLNNAGQGRPIIRFRVEMQEVPASED